MRALGKRIAMLGLLLLLLVGVACNSKTKLPPMPQVPNPAPGPNADALEVERYRLKEEKQHLAASYGDNLDRIQQINARLIEINIELRRRGGQP